MPDLSLLYSEPLCVLKVQPQKEPNPVLVCWQHVSSDTRGIRTLGLGGCLGEMHERRGRGAKMRQHLTESPDALSCSGRNHCVFPVTSSYQSYSWEVPNLAVGPFLGAELLERDITAFALKWLGMCQWGEGLHIVCFPTSPSTPMWIAQLGKRELLFA